MTRAAVTVRWRSVVGALVLAAAVVGVAWPVGAATDERPPVALDGVSDTALWSGEFVAGAFGVPPFVSLPEACTPQLCDIVPLDVQLPEGTWQQRPGGMLVATQAPVIDLFGAYDTDVFVYAPDDSLAASSVFIGANEAAWVPNPVNGRYTVLVVPKFVVSQPLVDDVLEPLRYDGFVRFDHGLTVQREERGRGGLPYTREFVAFGLTERRPAVELLPDLVPTTPQNFHIETAAGVPPLFYADRGLRHPPSCYPEETLGLTADEPNPSVGPLRCLRFDHGHHNFGDGPFQLNIYEDEVELRVFHVYQRIYTSDGDARQIGPLGEVRYHDLHGHFHYMGFQQITFHRIEEDGTLSFVKEKPDKGICTGDVAMGSFGRTDRPTSPLGYPGGTNAGLSGGDEPGGIRRGDNRTVCVESTSQDPNDPNFPDMPYIEMGISVGWADVYPWFIADQYIDITDVPDGDYALVVRQDVDDRILETNTRNNTAVGCVRLTGDVAEDISCEDVKLPPRTS